MKPQINRKRFLIVAGLALVLLAAGAVYALAQTDGVINACVLKDGTLRIVADPAECKKGETLYTWNITGPKGDPGLACWDLNGDGIQDAAEDINLDSLWDAADCKGPKGDAGDTANVDALQAQVDALQAEVVALHDQVDYVYSLHSNTVFLSSAVYDGAMGGLAGADAKCQALADAAGLPGTFKAWLSDATGSPSTRFTQSTLRYVRVDGVKVADDWADLTDITMTAGFLYAPINVTENGDQLSEADPVSWTNTRPWGGPASAYATCDNWTFNSWGSAPIGLYPAVDVNWTSPGTYARPCNTAHHIYCFEQ